MFANTAGLSSGRYKFSVVVSMKSPSKQQRKYLVLVKTFLWTWNGISSGPTVMVIRAEHNGLGLHLAEFIDGEDDIYLRCE
jgi:hypothetical protein